MAFLPEPEYLPYAKSAGFKDLEEQVADDMREVGAPGTQDSLSAADVPSGSDGWEEVMDQFERSNAIRFTSGNYWKDPDFPIGPRGGKKPLSEADIRLVQEKLPTFDSVKKFLRDMLAFLGNRLPELLKNDSEVDFGRLSVAVKAFGSQQGLPAGVSERIFRDFMSSGRYLRIFGDLEA